MSVHLLNRYRWSPYSILDYCTDREGNMKGIVANPIYINDTGMWNLLFLHSDMVDKGLYIGEPVEYTPIHELVMRDSHVHVAGVPLRVLARMLQLPDFIAICSSSGEFELKQFYDAIIPGGWKEMANERLSDIRRQLKYRFERDSDRMREVLGRNIYEFTGGN